jgi:regulatory protein
MTKKITALKLQKRNRNRVSIYLDGEYAFGLTKFVASWLQVGQELSESKTEELKAKDSIEIALHRAINFINYRPRSENEVRKNLNKHKTEEAVIEEVIERLQRGSMLNDENFAELWVENRSDFRPRGRRALRMELLQKGISDEIIETTLQDLDEDDLAYRAAQKQARKYRNLDWQDFRKKMNGFLARRGFNYGIISSIIPKVWEEVSSHIDQIETT